MIFSRSVPPRVYADYTRYRPLLRADFRYRCAYCLMHEFHLGGEAGCDIDHHRPRNGPRARPDLVNVYENLYWCCRECNQNKGDEWPTPEQYAAGRRFLDPCREEDDHDLHWRTLPDGSLEPLTPAGEYTIDCLMLWRDLLVFHRARCLRWQREREALRGLLAARETGPSRRATMERRLSELGEFIEPPVFARPRR